MIDICNGNAKNQNESVNFDWTSVSEAATSGNFNQKEHPENPIRYLRKNVGCTSIFRYIQTHPDMDHMDGIKNLFSSFEVVNFWDTENNKEMDDFSENGGYSKEDWDFYQSIRFSENNPHALYLYPDSRGRYYNVMEDDICDGISILSPTKKIVDSANDSGDYNELSYVIFYQASNRKILFAGDSGQKTWDYLLAYYKKTLSNIDVLIAPHHGRTTGGNDDYLDVLNPKISLLGNASSKYLDYDAWNNRNLFHMTNNQAGNVVLDIGDECIDVYVSNFNFAKKINSQCSFKEKKGFYIGYV